MFLGKLGRGSGRCVDAGGGGGESVLVSDLPLPRLELGIWREGGGIEVF